MFRFIKSKFLYVLGGLCLLSPAALIPIITTCSSGVALVFAIIGTLTTALCAGGASIMGQFLINCKSEEDYKNEFELKKEEMKKELQNSKVIEFDKIKKYYNTYVAENKIDKQKQDINIIKKIISLRKKEEMKDYNKILEKPEEHKVINIEDLTKS